MNRLQGVIVPVATPLLPDESLHREGLARLVEALIAAGVHGLFANGSMSGFAFHSDAMQREIIAEVCRLAQGRLPVLAGVSDTSVRRVLDRIRSIEGLPIDAVVVLAPYYFLYSSSELIDFFQSIADQSAFPVVLYENPRLVPVNSISPQQASTLARHPNIIGLKNSSADDAQWKLLFEQEFPRDRFALICGAEKRMGDGLRMGYDGLTGGFHNVFPEIAVSLYNAAAKGDWAGVDALQAKLNRAYRIFEIAGGWRGLEVALHRLGIASKTTVRPFDSRLSPAVRAEIEALVDCEKAGSESCLSRFGNRESGCC